MNLFTGVASRIIIHSEQRGGGGGGAAIVRDNGWPPCSLCVIRLATLVNLLFWLAEIISYQNKIEITPIKSNTYCGGAGAGAGRGTAAGQSAAAEGGGNDRDDELDESKKGQDGVDSDTALKKEQKS